MRQREDEERKRQILFDCMLDERKSKVEREINEERERLENEKIQTAEDCRRYDANERTKSWIMNDGSHTPIPDHDSAYSTSREPSRGSVST